MRSSFPRTNTGQPCEDGANATVPSTGSEHRLDTHLPGSRDTVARQWPRQRRDNAATVGERPRIARLQCRRLAGRWATGTDRRTGGRALSTGRISDLLRRSAAAEPDRAGRRRRRPTELTWARARRRGQPRRGRRSPAAARSPATGSASNSAPGASSCRSTSARCGPGWSRFRSTRPTAAQEVEYIRADCGAVDLHVERPTSPAPLLDGRPPDGRDDPRADRGGERDRRPALHLRHQRAAQGRDAVGARAARQPGSARRRRAADGHRRRRAVRARCR